MGDLITGYFNQAHKLDRRAYISRAKVGVALDGMEYFFAEYGEGIRRPATPKMELGRKLHFMTLEREEFRRTRCVHRFENLNSLKAQEWLKRVKIEHPTATIMSFEESLRFDRIVDRIMSHKVAGRLIATAIKERHGYAICPETGAILYSRPDIKTPEGEIAELKFVQSADPFRFNRQQFQMKWFMQLAFYNAVDGLIEGKRRRDNLFYIAVEDEYPHRLEVLPMHPDFEAMGDVLWKEGRDKILRCLARDPQMKNFDVWREDSFTPKTLKPEMFMMNNEERYHGLMAMGG